VRRNARTYPSARVTSSYWNARRRPRYAHPRIAPSFAQDGANCVVRQDLADRGGQNRRRRLDLQALSPPERNY
jgi:hypothetical protein